FWSWSQTPHGFAKGLLVSGKKRVSTPYVFHSPISNTPSPIAEITVGTVHVTIPPPDDPLPLKKPTDRKTIPFGLLSARATPAASSPETTATTSIPRPTIRMTVLLTPPAPPLRIRDGARSPHPRAPRTRSAQSPRDRRSGCAPRPTSCRTAWRARAPRA